jgi:sec-independent protein translocase protein TatA
MMSQSAVLMFMGMGAMEIAVILLAVLMLFGAKGIPGIARGLGSGIRQMKDAAGEIQRELQRNAETMQKDLMKDNAIKEITEDPLKETGKKSDA